jgi:hypothetical protein
MIPMTFILQSALVGSALAALVHITAHIERILPRILQKIRRTRNGDFNIEPRASNYYDKRGEA